VHEGVNVLGVLVSPIHVGDARRAIEAWITSRAQTYVTVTSAHAIMDAYRDPELRRVVNNAGMTTPDGMSVVWLLRLRGHRATRRVYGPDLMLEICRDGVSKGYRHFLLGGEPGVADGLGSNLAQRIPGVDIVGTVSPPFDALSEQDDRRLVEQVNAAGPDIVWVGLGSPKQERWMADHLGRVTAPVMVGVGAAFDFLSGRKRQAPRWVQRMGFEWLFRLASEPRRLWPRYRQYPWFVALVLEQALGLRQFTVE
jgi:N-acetylglucosaminyldiphosphoundecaprenol N-acetyl-beta-D-mannosaminyltransferase